jgi:6-phosphogluconolactonase (cycloisomerase 2 family)
MNGIRGLGAGVVAGVWALLLTACGGGGGAGETPPAPTAKLQYAYVSNWTDGTVSQFAVGPGGGLVPLATPTVGAGIYPSTVMFSSSGAFVYVANADGDSISQYGVRSDGSLVPLAPATVQAGHRTMALAMSATTRRLYAANQSGSIWTYDVAADGALRTPSDPSSGSVLSPTLMGGNGATTLAVDPLGRYVYAPEVGFGTLFTFAVEPTGALRLLMNVFPPTGGHPMGMQMHPTASWLYLVSPHAHTVSQFSLGADGVPVPMAVPTVAAEQAPVAMAIAPSGLWAYVANSTSKSISQYRIDAVTGELHALARASIPVGTELSGMTVDTTSRYLYVTDSVEHGIWQFAIGSDGQLTPLAPPFVATGRAPMAVAVGMR